LLSVVVVVVVTYLHRTKERGTKMNQKHLRIHAGKIQGIVERLDVERDTKSKRDLKREQDGKRGTYMTK